MTDEIGLWVKMLTGALGNVPDPEVLSLEEACRTLEAQIASLQNNRDPRQQTVELEKLESNVSGLSERHTAIKNECARLEEELRNAFERIRTGALASHEARSQQKLTSDAVETVRRATDFFKMDFSAMTPAQIDNARPQIAAKLAAARKRVGKRISASHDALKQHAEVRERIQECEAELGELNKEIKGVEEQ